MSTVSQICCDKCKKRTDDHYAEKGWLQIGASSGSSSFSQSRGRRKDGQATTGFHTWCGFMHFCSFKCLTGFIESL